jgi:hypothetical protein
MEMAGNITNDLWSFSVGMIGILVSVMTLLYASLSSKVEELTVLKKSKEYITMNRATAVERTVKALQRLNRQVIRLLVMSFVLFLLSTVLKYFYVCWLLMLDMILALLLIVLCVGLAYKIYSQYQNETSV